MNQKDRERLKEPLSYFHIEDRKHLNCIRLDYAEIDKKGELKCWKKLMEYCFEFRKNHIPFLVQARLVGRGNKVIGRPDIVTLLNYQAYEIVSTETQKRLEAKDYRPFEIIKITV